MLKVFISSETDRWLGPAERVSEKRQDFPYQFIRKWIDRVGHGSTQYQISQVLNFLLFPLSPYGFQKWLHLV